MTYTLTEFASVALPTMMPIEDVGSGKAMTRPLQSPGKLFDPLRADRAVIGKGQIDRQSLIHSTTEAVRVSEYKTLRGLLGVRGRLHRQQDGEATSEWVVARLVQATSRRSVKDYNHCEIRMIFEKYSPYWRDQAPVGEWYLNDGEVLNDGLVLDSEETTFTLDVSPKTLAVTNDGNAILIGLKFHLVAGSANITALKIATDETEIDYTGTIAAGQGLLIDCGARSVLNNGSNDRANFSLGSGHIINEWFRLHPGESPVTITITGGSTDSTISFGYSHGWV